MKKISVVIPTQNRAETLISNVTDILTNNTGAPFEILVVDNSTERGLGDYFRQQNYPSVKYVYTGGLNMAENWEQAFLHADGEFIVVLGDKIRLVPQALNCLDRILSIASPNLLCWRASHSKIKLPVRFSEKKITKIDSNVFYKKCCESDIGFLYENAPSSYRMCIKKSFFHELKEKYHLFCRPISPDFTSCFLSVLNCESYIKYDDILIYRGGNTGNGFSSYYSGPMLERFLRDYGISEIDCVKHAPIEIYTVNNSIMSDFINIACLSGRKDVVSSIDMVSYVRCLFNDLMLTNCKLHIDVTPQLRVLYSYIEKFGLWDNEKIVEMLSDYDQTLSNRRMNFKYILSNSFKLYWTKALKKVGRYS